MDRVNAHRGHLDLLDNSRDPLTFRGERSERGGGGRTPCVVEVLSSPRSHLSLPEYLLPPLGSFSEEKGVPLPALLDMRGFCLWNWANESNRSERAQREEQARRKRRSRDP
ncbi:hypothetical protein EYF80_063623 [Liparis tanakae]|uniref:Uncharacterized protein n=1 Tax=Liparis tanakae TaxID=230148 RepID=A0A4Z2ECE4_9TELE|nr:hypothetical protein EYF80_063623 [Liparis tanakae]